MTRRDEAGFWEDWLIAAFILAAAIVWALHVSPPPVSVPGGGVTVSPESSPGETHHLNN